MKKLLMTVSLAGILLISTGCDDDRNNMAEQPGTPEGRLEDTSVAADTMNAPAETSSPSSMEQAGNLDAWTAGTVVRPAPGTGASTLTEVRAGLHHEYDRVVFEFGRDSIPGYHVEYVDKPVRKCGSGNVVEVAGDGWLEVRMNPARAHTEAGEATITERSRLFDMPVLKQLELTCDFEANVTWVLGVASPNRYRVKEVPDPARLVIDVKH